MPGQEFQTHDPDGPSGKLFQLKEVIRNIANSGDRLKVHNAKDRISWLLPQLEKAKELCLDLDNILV